MPLTIADKTALFATSALVPLVGYLTLSPGQELPVTPPSNDKVSHGLAWAAMSFPMAAARPEAIKWIIPAAVALGIAVEIIQPSVGRSREASDVVADTVGTIAGCVVGWILHKTLTTKKMT